MYAIAKHDKGAALSVATSPVPNHSDIARWWNGTLPASQHDGVMNTLGKLKQRGLWLACSCTNTRKDPPLLSPAQTKAGGVTLRRMTERAPHTTECVFTFEQREPKSLDRDQIDLGGNNEPEVQPQFLEQIAPTRLAKSPKRESKEGEGGGKGRGKATNPLASQLHWLLSKSGLQQWPMPWKSSLQALLDVAKGMQITKELNLDSLLYCTSRAWTDAWMQKSFDTCVAHGLEAQAILICPVQSASRAESWVRFTEDGDKVAVDGHISIWGDDVAPARYPMLMYAKVTRKPREAPRIIKAYLHPILSLDHWMLVDSNYEREAFKTIQLACRVLEKKGISCNIEKPIYNWRDTDARPDFVINGRRNENNQILVVETMGTSDPEYAARKKITVSKLAAYTVFEDHRHQAASDVDSRLLRFALGYMQSKLDSTGHTE